MSQKKINSVKRSYFGTDGIRAPLDAPCLQPPFVSRLGWGIVQALRQSFGLSEKCEITVCVGRDTRHSGPMLEKALTKGLVAGGGNVCLLGVVPTPAVSILTPHLSADLGIMITASHNGAKDNGIKLIDAKGCKVSLDFEGAVETMMQNAPPNEKGNPFGSVHDCLDARAIYQDFLKARCSDVSLQGRHLVVDCAHGAQHGIANQVLCALGARVTVIGSQPSGWNINKNCGAVSPESLQSRVLVEKADAGIGFDGDGDRLVMVDANGHLLNGDVLLYIIAKHRVVLGHPSIEGVVGTDMSNMGLECGLARLGIAFKRVAVGDRAVLQACRQLGWCLGGEPSGHIMLGKAMRTGDGLGVALTILQAMQKKGSTLAELYSGYQPLPHLLINLPMVKKTFNREHPTLKQALTQARLRLGKNGRLLLRASGTEPVLRLMLEGSDREQLVQIGERLKKVVEALSV